jgi:hypothetical protein
MKSHATKPAPSPRPKLTSSHTESERRSARVMIYFDNVRRHEGEWNEPPMWRSTLFLASGNLHNAAVMKEHSSQ